MDKADLLERHLNDVKYAIRAVRVAKQSFDEMVSIWTLNVVPMEYAALVFNLDASATALEEAKVKA